MTKHLADKRSPATGTRVAQFLRIAREGNERLWQDLRRRPVPVPADNRRAAEFLRIDRGRQV